MNSKEFQDILEARLDKIQTVLGAKGKEYSSGDDRLHNFRVAAQSRGISMEKALDGMMLKHEISVQDLINNPNRITLELINEKIGDNINYLILLEAVMIERLKGSLIADVRVKP